MSAFVATYGLTAAIMFGVLATVMREVIEQTKGEPKAKAKAFAGAFLALSIGGVFLFLAAVTRQL